MGTTGTPAGQSALPRSSVRRRVHVSAAIGYAFFLYVFSPMNLLLFGWFADFEDLISHRVHEVSIGALFTLGFIGVLAHVKRDERAGGAIQAVIVLCFAAGIITVSTGFEPLVLAYLIPPLLLIALDPDWRQTVAPALRTDRRLMTLAWLLVVLVGPEMTRNFVKASNLVQGHEAHWGAMAAFALAVALLALVVAARPPGWRLVLWSIVAAVVVNAMVSMAFRFDASSLGIARSWLALLWAVGFLVTASIASSVRADVPTRLPDRGLVAGVAIGLSIRLGWKVGWIRAAFAVPLVGTAAYSVLWLALPTEGPAAIGRWPRRLFFGMLIVVGLGAVVGGSAIGVAPAVLLGLVLAVISRVARRKPVSGTTNHRPLLRLAANLGFSVAVLALVLVWLGDDLSAPDVPHRVERVSVIYCSSCHGIEGVARGAPIIEDLSSHSDGAACVTCHSHLPVNSPQASPAIWDLPLRRLTP